MYSLVSRNVNNFSFTFIFIQNICLVFPAKGTFCIENRSIFFYRFYFIKGKREDSVLLQTILEFSLNNLLSIRTVEQIQDPPQSFCQTC